MKLLVNKLEVPKCDCVKTDRTHWAGGTIRRVLGRGLTDADLIEVIEDDK
jgi:hypothetical protein